MHKYNLDEKQGLFSLLQNKNILKILSPGAPVTIKHFKMNEYLDASINDLTQTTLTIEILSQYNEPFMFPKDHVVVNYTSSKEVYVISGEVQKVISINPIKLIMEIKAIETLGNLRKGSRYYVSIPANIKVRGYVQSIFAVVKNISVGGIKVNCSEYIDKNRTLDVEIIFDKMNKMNFEGIIVRNVRIDDYYEYGIEISGITESNSRSLHHFINWMSYHDER